MVKDTSKDIASVIEELELPGMETKQSGYFFGSINSEEMVPDAIGEDEIQIVEECYEHFGVTGSDSNSLNASNMQTTRAEEEPKPLPGGASQKVVNLTGI